jgi:hypothetical protein
VDEGAQGAEQVPERAGEGEVGEERGNGRGIGGGAVGGVEDVRPAAPEQGEVRVPAVSAEAGV